jgi:hypothetical protein
VLADNVMSTAVECPFPVDQTSVMRTRRGPKAIKPLQQRLRPLDNASRPLALALYLGEIGFRNVAGFQLRGENIERTPRKAAFSSNNWVTLACITSLNEGYFAASPVMNSRKRTCGTSRM